MATATRSRRPRPPRDLPRQIHSLQDDLSKYYRFLIFGDPGTGKTPLACTAPNALVGDGDGGLVSALTAGSTAKVWTLNDWNDMLALYEWLRDGGTKEFDWLILDSLTLFQERGMDNVMDDLVASPKGSHRSIYLPDKGEYGQNMNRLGRTLRDLKRLPINQVWTAHAQVFEVPQDNGEIVERIMPAIQGGKGDLSRKICGYVSVVGHLEQITKTKTVNGKKKTTTTPVLITDKKNGWYGKDRHSAIGRMLNPTIPKMVAAIEGKLDPTKKTQQESE